MNKVLATAIILLNFSILYSQESGKTTPSTPSITWSGFVKAESMFDTRQVVEAREGYLLLYPKRVNFDKNGNDINAHGSFNQYAMITRLAAKIAGPNVLKANVSALIEGDFTGASNSENNSFRLRHAYIKMKWKNSALIAGQYWHPINVPEMLPGVLSLNTGAPFHPFSRQPQIRFEVRKGNFNSVLVASSQRDYMNVGPSGASTIYQRNSIIPNLNFQLQYVGSSVFAGAAIDYKKLTPRIQTDSLLSTNEFVNCLSYLAFAKISLNSLVIKTQFIYGQGLNDHLLLGGYGVSDENIFTNEKTYAALNYMSSWITINTTGKVFQASLFAGYTKGFGAKEKIISKQVYARDPEIDYIYRIAPMFTYNLGQLVLASEIEFTAAAYGVPGDFYKIKDAGKETANNWRFIMSIGYFF